MCFQFMNAEHDEVIEFLRKNILFTQFSESQLSLVASIIQVTKFSENELIIKEDLKFDNIYLIKEGQVSVEKKDPQTDQIFKLATLGPGSVIGEIALLDDSPRSASVRALEPTTVYGLSINDLRRLSEDQKKTQADLLDQLDNLRVKIKSLQMPIFPLMLQNIAQGLGKNVRSMNASMIDVMRAQLESLKLRVAMGFTIIAILVNLALYIIATKFISVLTHAASSTTAIDGPLIIFFAIGIVWAMLKSGYPLSFYGFNLDNWRSALFEGLVSAIVLMILTVILKWLLLKFMPHASEAHLFSMIILHPEGYIWALIYLILAPVQEIIVRGALQSSFQAFFVGRHTTLISIIISNLLFSAVHFHISILVGMLVFVPGLLWGWLYHRNKTLLGVSISHQIVGIWALFIVGLFTS